jgi:GT2 family glycosyltransferase
MPYHDRIEQFWNTLVSLQHWYSCRDDWEVIVIIDGADQQIDVPVGIQHRVITQRVVRQDVNPAPLFNLAAKIATGEYFVITNPECYHAADVLKWMDRAFSIDPMGYAVAACDHVEHVGRIDSYRDSLGTFLEHYQHGWNRNVLYHFCSALHRDQYARLGGFDERFGSGYACEDDDFRDRVVCAGIKWFINNDAKVLHQKHGKLKHTPDIQRRYHQNLIMLQEGERRRGWKFSLREMRTRANTC